MSCNGRCKGAMPEIDSELIKAVDIVVEYYRDYCNSIGCKNPSAQCFMHYVNNIIFYKLNFLRIK